MSKRILIIKACGVVGEEEECISVKSQMELFNVSHEVIEPKDVAELESELNQRGRFDYIYLSAHGNDKAFANKDQSLYVLWEDFAGILCNTGCMNIDSIIMLSCCRGGLNQVAYQMFSSCPMISYVIGPRQSLRSAEMLIAFNVIFYNIMFRGIDPVVACEKAKAATDLRFVCFDRLEVEVDPAYMMKYDNSFFLSQPLVVPPEVIALQARQQLPGTNN